MTANVLEHLGDEFEFPIVTSDRDVGDYSPHPVALRVAALARVKRPLGEVKPKDLAGWWRKAVTEITNRMDDRALGRVRTGLPDPCPGAGGPGFFELRVIPWSGRTGSVVPARGGFRPAVGRGAIRCRHSRGDGLRRARATIEARFAEEVAGQAFLEVWDRLLKRAGKR
jgi:hypothetical protein